MAVDTYSNCGGLGRQKSVTPHCTDSSVMHMTFISLTTSFSFSPYHSMSHDDVFSPSLQLPLSVLFSLSLFFGKHEVKNLINSVDELSGIVGEAGFDHGIVEQLERHQLCNLRVLGAQSVETFDERVGRIHFERTLHHS